MIPTHTHTGSIKSLNTGERYNACRYSRNLANCVLVQRLKGKFQEDFFFFFLIPSQLKGEHRGKIKQFCYRCRVA